MIKRHREKMRQSSDYIRAAISLVEAVRDDRQDSLDNTPENLQSGSRYERREEIIDYLDKAVDDLEHAQEMISEVL